MNNGTINEEEVNTHDHYLPYNLNKIFPLNPYSQSNKSILLIYSTKFTV